MDREEERKRGLRKRWRKEESIDGEGKEGESRIRKQREREDDVGEKSK